MKEKHQDNSQMRYKLKEKGKPKVKLKKFRVQILEEKLEKIPKNIPNGRPLEQIRSKGSDKKLCHLP